MVLTRAGAKAGKRNAAGSKGCKKPRARCVVDFRTMTYGDLLNRYGSEGPWGYLHAAMTQGYKLPPVFENDQ